MSYKRLMYIVWRELFALRYYLIKVKGKFIRLGMRAGSR